MKKIACQYAIVRFAPFVETGEFANVGIIMMAPKGRFFGFELETKRYSRITNFFAELDAKIYKKALYNLKDELERANDILKAHGFDKRRKDNDVDFANTFFNEIVRFRETIVRFGEVRTVLAADPKKKLKDLFEFYVGHNFATKKYQEALMESTVRKLLVKVNVGDKFSKGKVGDDAYHATFPFVEHYDHKVKKVIKPLHLAYDDPTRIRNHGAQWIYTIQKLKGKFITPENILFTLSKPKFETKCLDAYHEIENGLQDLGVNMTATDKESDIVDFALN